MCPHIYLQFHSVIKKCIVYKKINIITINQGVTQKANALESAFSDGGCAPNSCESTVAMVIREYVPRDRFLASMNYLFLYFQRWPRARLREITRCPLAFLANFIQCISNINLLESVYNSTFFTSTYADENRLGLVELHACSVMLHI